MYGLFSHFCGRDILSLLRKEFKTINDLFLSLSLSNLYKRFLTSGAVVQYCPSSFLPSSEIPNGSDDDAIMTFESETVPNDPVGAPMNQSEFFRHDSFSNEMPDNLFDD